MMPPMWKHLPVVSFVICDHDNEEMHEADNNRYFEETDALLNRLREENPDANYTMYAEVDA